MSDRPILVLQHIACEPPAAYGEEMRAWGLDLECVRVDLGEALPPWTDYCGVVAMGGPMGADEDGEFPWLSMEKAFIADAVRGGAPFLGVCLGAQLLASSLGGQVSTGAEPEVGVCSVGLTPEGVRDPVFGVLPTRFDTLQWHSDTYRLPEGATRLAGSEAYVEQAFVVGRAYGVQFHLEVTSDLAWAWADEPEYAASLEAVHGAGAVPNLLAEVRAAEPQTSSLARRLVAAWLESACQLSKLPTTSR